MRLRVEGVKIDGRTEAGLTSSPCCHLGSCPSGPLLRPNAGHRGRLPLAAGKRLAQLWHHISEHFGDNEPVIRISGPRLGAYVTARLDAGAARGTIKNEMNALRRAFKLAQRSGTLLANEVPVFPTAAQACRKA